MTVPTPYPVPPPPPQADKEPSDLHILSNDEHTFTAEIFGETFRFAKDVNPWLMLMLGTGENTAKALIELLHSIIEVDVPPEATPEEADVARQAEADRFSSLLGRQRNFKMERLFRIVNDLITAAGNETTPSSDA